MQLALTDKIVPRSEAMSRGLIYYFTGIPCKNGHVSQRLVSGRGCVDCKSKYDKEYRESMKDSIGDQRSAYRKSKKELIKEKNKIYYEKNKSKIKLKQKNSEKGRAYSKAYAERNPEKVREIKRNYSARKRGADGRHSSQDVFDIFVAQNGRCNACKTLLLPDGRNKYHVDHVLPLSKGGSNWPDNLQLLCPPCNMSKGAKSFCEWLTEKCN